jgi:hypothetical protein
MVECKSPAVRITGQVFEQIGLYNLTYRLNWLIVTNGLQHFCCKMNDEKGKYDFVDEIPEWTDLRTK